MLFEHFKVVCCYYLDKSSDLETRLAKMDELLTLFTTERHHQVLTYTDVKETKLEAQKWRDHTITLHYPKQIQCTKEELVDEMRVGWPVLSRKWQMEVMRVGKQAEQVKVITSFVEGGDAGTMFPHLCSLFKMLLAMPANTSPLERSYTHLQRICAPRRNQILPEHLETLYLLATLKIPVKRPGNYNKEIEALEGKK